jgi:hypothetical protein
MNKLTDYERGQRDVLQFLFDKHNEIKNEECPDCDKPCEESEYTYCDVVCFQLNLILDTLRYFGYSIKLKENEMVRDESSN